MVNLPSQGTSAESLVQELRLGNAAKLAALGSVAHATRIGATLQRLQEYTEAFTHAHETGNLEEAQGLAIAMSRAAITLSAATTDLDNALSRELAAGRAA